MIELGPEFTAEAARLLPVEHQEQDLGQDGALQRKMTSAMYASRAPLQSLAAPPEVYPASPSLEQSPDSEEQGQIREWQDGYKPARRQRKKPRPGETTFRVPMSVEQRKSLGASVRPREVQATGPSNGQAPDGEENALAEILPSSVTRGGIKLKFRAYGSSMGSANTQTNDGPHPSPGTSSMAQEAGFSEQQSVYQHSDLEALRCLKDVEFLSAPLDNGPKLAWWLAQQISHTNSWQTSNNLTSRLPELTVSQFYGQSESPLDRRRQVERQRKAKWREANAEKNRENDLRARVKRQARAKFGDIESSETNNWITTEVARRRARREDKQISQAAKSGQYPSFADSEVIRHTLLREGRDFDLKPAVREVKKLIIDVLFPALTQADMPHRLHAIELLSKTVNLRQPHEDDSFQAALSSIAQDENAFCATRSLLEQFKGDDDEETSLDGSSTIIDQNNPSIPELPQTAISPGQTLTALDEALAILSELVELGNEQQASCVQLSAADVAAKQRQRYQVLHDLGVSESQLNEFLVLVNGGPLKPDPDDHLARELYGKQLAFDIYTLPPQQISSTVSDTATWDVANSALDALLQRCIPPPKRGRRTNQVVARETRARKQAAKLRALLNEIEIGGNRVRSRTESQAISEFYSRITSFSKTGTFGVSLDLPLSQHQRSSLTINSQPSAIPAPGTRRKRKRMDSTGLGKQSPPIALALPSTTSPFDDGQQVAPAAASASIPSPITTTGSASSTTHTTHSSHKSQHTLPLPSPVQPRIQLHVEYPQFQSMHLSENIQMLDRM